MLPVVFTMGKVGSTSVRNSLIRAGLLCFDVHSLRPSGLDAEVRSWRMHAKALRDCGIKTADNVVYVTLVREPVGRNLSGFFQNLGDRHPGGLPALDQVIDSFLKDYHHALPSIWFQKQFQLFARFNVYRQAFDHATGYAVHRRRDKPDVILMRAELPDPVKAEVLSEYFGREIQVTRDNDASAKDYSELYRQAREPGRLPAAYIEEMYASEYARHFWSVTELNLLRAQWAGIGGVS